MEKIKQEIGSLCIKFLWKKKSLAWARNARLQLPLVRKLPMRLSGKKILAEKADVKLIVPNSPHPFLCLLNVTAYQPNRLKLKKRTEMSINMELSVPVHHQNVTAFSYKVKT